ncbi:cation diffusion facilitator family transporter [Pseudarthrobacter phenanthrenivorans Sphe3]|uniref:Cation diffusion facilitator family transporter n=2 Tax=Pseudarthrobacter phenanthrenivorans TaxID=361575 RepID=F0M1L6_PSEPM|nr:cation diffusion facilitator family transporter [Pseudarthrobacter phenanthrenivorans Sphe3]
MKSYPIDPAVPEGMAARQNAGREAVLTSRIRLLVAATISYNIIEAVVAVSAGTTASSTALIGFGLDSVIEVSSAAAVAWQFSGRDPRAREQRALRLIALAFFALAAFVTVSAVRSLLGAGEAEHSTVGIILAAVSLVVMPFLSLAQRRAGRELGSRSAVADSRQTLLCTYLSGVLLMGLVLNSTLGWSWADPVAALVIAAAAVKEGLDAWKGEGCCVPASTHAGQGTTTAAPVSGGHAPAAGLLIGTKKASDGGGACGCCHDTAVQAATPGEPRHT